MNIPNTNLPRVVIVGGGFAGLNIAKKLKDLPIQIVLINKHNYHTFQPLLYQVSTSGLEPGSIAYPLRKLLKKNNFFFRLAKVEKINAETKTLQTSIGDLSYDYLVINTGTKTNYFGNKEIEKYAMPMKTIPQALNIRSLILQNFERASITEDKELQKAYLNFVIVGAGPTGVELSGAIAEYKKKIIKDDYPDLDSNDMEIHLLEGMDRVLPPMSSKSSIAAEKFLKDLDVQIHKETIVTKYDGFNVETKDGKKFKSFTLIWSAGVIGNYVKGLPETCLNDRTHRYYVNQYNQVKGFTEIFALGDIALMETEDYPRGHPQVAQPAIQQADLFVENFKKLLNNQPLKPFKYFDKGSMATIGRNKAVVDIGKIHFAGFFAWFVWMFVHLMALVGFRNRLVVFVNWIYNYINFDKATRLIIRPFSMTTRMVRRTTE